jgi:maltodextrin utilization protein YvdJ
MKWSTGCICGIAIAVLLSGCASTPQRPAWIDNPSPGVSSSAGMNVNGRVAQEETAISRARTEFAKRFGVTIDAGQIMQTSFSNDHSSTVGKSVSMEQTNQTDVKAMVKAKWYDENTDTVYVWIVPTK